MNHEEIQVLLNVLETVSRCRPSKDAVNLQDGIIQKLNRIVNKKEAKPKSRKRRKS